MPTNTPPGNPPKKNKKRKKIEKKSFPAIRRSAEGQSKGFGEFQKGGEHNEGKLLGGWNLIWFE